MARAAALSFRTPTMDSTVTPPYNQKPRMAKTGNIPPPKTLRFPVKATGLPPVPVTPNGCGIISCQAWPRPTCARVDRSREALETRHRLPSPMWFGQTPKPWIPSPGPKTNMATPARTNTVPSPTSNRHGLPTAWDPSAPTPRTTGGARITTCLAPPPPFPPMGKTPRFPSRFR